jgi:hypothetical protein
MSENVDTPAPNEALGILNWIVTKLLLIYFGFRACGGLVLSLRFLYTKFPENPFLNHFEHYWTYIFLSLIILAILFALKIGWGYSVIGAAYMGFIEVEVFMLLTEGLICTMIGCDNQFEWVNGMKLYLPVGIVLGILYGRKFGFLKTFFSTVFSVLFAFTMLLINLLIFRSSDIHSQPIFYICAIFAGILGALVGDLIANRVIARRAKKEEASEPPLSITQDS